MSKQTYTLELGPIRPPSEATSMLLRLVRNCPWNQCAFCHSYKNAKFSIRSIDAIMQDIDTIVTIYELMTKLRNTDTIMEKRLYEVIQKENIPVAIAEQVLFWMQHGLKHLFLQDADALVMKTADIVQVLNYLKKQISSIERITTYARARTLSRKSMEELIALRNAGINRIHSGMESGSDKILTLIKKGSTSDEQIRAGKNCVAAGFELSEYFIPGLGGKKLSEENALASAQVLNEINPAFIRIRSIVPLPDTPLFNLLTENQWLLPSAEDTVKELRLFIESLTVTNCIIKSDHIMNLLEEVEGTLPQDKLKMLATIDSFLAMNQDAKECFCIGRRIGLFHTLADFQCNKHAMEIEQFKNYIREHSITIDEALLQVLWNYI